MKHPKNTPWMALLGLTLALGVGVVSPSFAQDAADQTSADAAAAPIDPLADPAALPPPPAGVGEVETTTEEVENPYGFKAAWTQGDYVSKGTFIILLIMSAATWYIMIVKLIEQQKLFSQSRVASKQFWGSATLNEGLAKLKAGTPFWYLADRGMSASQHHEGTLVERIDLNEWVTMSVDRSVEEINSRLSGGLAVLATVGSTAPFVGLFGTVWGIYHALTAIGISGQASIDKVAGPVGEALIMTAIGLAVAVPAVMGYNWLIRRNKSAMESVRAFAGDLHAVLLSGGRVDQSKLRSV